VPFNAHFATNIATFPTFYIITLYHLPVLKIKYKIIPTIGSRNVRIPQNNAFIPRFPASSYTRKANTTTKNTTNNVVIIFINSITSVKLTILCTKTFIYNQSLHVKIVYIGKFHENEQIENLEEI
jgi:hypothetical protein